MVSWEKSSFLAKALGAGSWDSGMQQMRMFLKVPRRQFHPDADSKVSVHDSVVASISSLCLKTS